MESTFEMQGDCLDMRGFFASKVGNTITGIVLAVAVFVLLNVVIGLGGAVGGAIAGIVGFGVASFLSSIFKAEEPRGSDSEGETDSQGE